jgi:hypothetical protein
MTLSDVLVELILTPENLDGVLNYIDGDGNTIYGHLAEQVAHHFAALARILIELDNPPGQKARVLWLYSSGTPVPCELYGLSDIELLRLCNKLLRDGSGE